MKKMLHKALVFTIAALVIPLASGCISMSKSKTFNSVDTNHNDKITQKEFSAYFFRAAFVQLDQNGDGTIKIAEWVAVEDGAEEMFKAMDLNKDNSLTLAEFSEPDHKQETVNNLFKTMDDNNDGSLTKKELAD